MDTEELEARKEVVEEQLSAYEWMIAKLDEHREDLFATVNVVPQNLLMRDYDTTVATLTVLMQELKDLAEQLDKSKEAKVRRLHELQNEQ